MSELKGKVAIITGSTSGMGRDTAYYFAEQGAKVVVTGRREERLKEVVDKIKADGGEATYIVADTSKPDQVRAIYDGAMDAFGTIDILFNNAGAISFKDSFEIDSEEWLNMFQINVNAMLELSRLCAKVMKDKGRGYIVNTGSIAGTGAKWGAVAYCTTKHAVNGLTKSMARDFGPEVNVNAILPGAIATEMLDSAGGADGDAIAPMKNMSPLKRIGTGREIATVVEFLASDKASFITGQCIRVDGGVDC